MSVSSDAFAKRVAAVLASLGQPDALLLGQGGEGRVFALSDERVVKIYGDVQPTNLRPYLESLATLLAQIDRHTFPFRTPRIHEIGQVDDTWYTIDRRLVGQQFQAIYPTLSEVNQCRLLGGYLDVAWASQAIQWPELPYGQVINLAGMITNATWSGFLRAKVTQVLPRSLVDLRRDVALCDEKVERFMQEIERLPDDFPKRLVHGDFFPGNMLFGAGGEVSALLDFSPHTLVGDPRLDLASAIVCAELVPPLTFADRDALYRLALARFGAEAMRHYDLYTLYLSFYFSDTAVSDPTTYAWCVRNLNDDAIWERLVAA